MATAGTRHASSILNVQCGIIAARQLEAAGISPARTRANVEAERWQRCTRGVYAAFTGELSWLQRVWVAVLACGATAAAAGTTALRLYGLPPPTPVDPWIHVSVDHAHQVRDFGTVVELDGRLGHETARDRWSDMDRDNLATASDLHTIRLSYAQVVGSPCRTAWLVGQVLGGRGWKDEPVPCGPAYQLP